MDPVSSMLDMKIYFEERMAKFEEDLQKSSSSNTTGLAEKFSSFKGFVLQTLQTFSSQLQSVAREVDMLEMHSRRKILLLHGIQEQKDEDVVQAVTGVVKQHLKIDSFTLADVKRCHRMGRESSEGKPRPILIKLYSISVRNNMWNSKTKLKGTGITLSEFLTRSRHNAFMAARERFGVTKCWTREGTVHVITTDGVRHRITSVGDLNKIKCDVEKAKSTRPKRTAPKK